MLVSHLEIMPPRNLGIVNNYNLSIPEVDYTKHKIKLLPLPEPLRVSIIFVARNENEWLRKTLDSLYQAKTTVPYEVIVYDDASLDQCCYDLAVHKLYRASNQPVGPSRARNLGAMRALGDILVFGDAHLKFKDDWLEQLIAPIEQDWCDVVNPMISDIAIPSTKGCGWNFSLDDYQYHWGPIPTEFKLVPGMAGGCFAIKTKVFKDVGMFDKAFLKWGLEDSELALRLSLSGYRIGAEPKVNVGHFFKEVNEYGVDWASYSYNFLRMAYVNLEQTEVDIVYSLIKGDEHVKHELLLKVMDTSKYRKRFCQSIRKLSFIEYQQRFNLRKTHDE